MAYDTELADRIRHLVQGETPVDERAMFGGLAFLVGGHMAVAAGGQGHLMVRCDPAETEQHLAPPAVDRVEMRGRAMNGWLHVEHDAVSDDEVLEHWVEVGTTYARSLPPKAPR